MPVYPGASVEQQRDHHRRVIRRPAAPVDPIGRVEHVEVQLRHRVDDKPRQVPRRQPLADVGRHQKRLLAITSDKALAHREIVLNPPDGTRTYATATCQSIGEVTPGPLRRPPPRLAPLPRAYAPSSSGPRRGALRAGRLARAVLGRTFAAPYTARAVLTRRPALSGRAT